MLSPRTELILQSIVRQYVARAEPVSSALILEDCGLDVCSATIRNEVAKLEQEGYIVRPHHAAGSVPSDMGYRYYVEHSQFVGLSREECLTINHLFHQVERELGEWLKLSASLIARKTKNVALVSSPKSNAYKLHHVEIVSLQGDMALVVVILRGAKVKQQLINFPCAFNSEELSYMSNRLSHLFEGKTKETIKHIDENFNENESLVVDTIIKVMRIEDEKSNEDPFLDGMQFMLKQPEFSRTARLTEDLMGMVEDKTISRAIELPGSHDGVRITIGNENREEAVQNFSIVTSSYGVEGEAVGSISVIGPTRMEYNKAVSTIRYLSLVMSKLVNELYGYNNLSMDNKYREEEVT